MKTCLTSLLVFCAAVLPAAASAAQREEDLDRQPPHWEGINNRGSQFESQLVPRNFGYRGATTHAGANPGEVGRTIILGRASYRTILNL